MRKLVNHLNAKWNQLVYWFHDAATRTGISWLVRLSIWAYDRLFWRLPEEWQLVCGVPFKEYTLRHELEVARHQTRYFANYAYDLQCRILFSAEEPNDAKTQKREKSARASFAGEGLLDKTNNPAKPKKRKKANK